MAIAGMMGGAMGGAGKAMMGGGNGGSFAQKQMMRQQPMMQQRPNMMKQMSQPRPQMGNAFGNRMAQQFQQMRQPPQMGLGPRMGQTPGFNPNIQLPDFMRSGNTGIAGGMNRGGTPPYFPQDGGMMRPQVQGPNGEAPSQQGGFAEMLRKMQQMQGGGNEGMARPHVMPRGIAPQLSMMPQMMQQPRQPNPWGVEYDQPQQEEMY